MVKTDLIERNPLRQLAGDREDILADGAFGAVLSRAGIGKTALVIQMALFNMLRHKNVLHVSLNDPIGKVTLWYGELFQDIAEEYNVNNIKDIWNDIEPYRLILSMKVSGFSVPLLEERITDLTTQNIFNPSMVIIDGFPFDETARDHLKALRTLAERNGFSIWFTVHTHRDEQPAADNLPACFSPVADLFAVALELKPEGNNVRIETLAGSRTVETPLLLNPTTMLVTQDTQSKAV